MPAASSYTDRRTKKTAQKTRTLQKQLAFSFLFLTLLISISISVFSYLITYRVLRERLSSTYGYTIDYIANSVDIEIKRIENLTNYLFVNESIKKAILLKGQDTIESVNSNYQAYSEIKQYFMAHSLTDINSISIFGYNGYHLYYYSSLDEKESINIPGMLKNWSSKLKGSNGNIVWGSLQPKYFGLNSIETLEIPLFRSIKNLNYSENIGFMFISLKPAIFSKLIQIYDSTYPDFAENSSILVTHEGHVLLNSNELPVSIDQVNGILSSKDSFSLYGFASPDDDYVAFARRLPEPAWHIIGRVPKSFLYFNARYIFYSSVVAAFLTVFASSLLWLNFSSRIFKPLKELAEVMKRIEMGEKHLRARVISNNEVGMLSLNLNNMLDRNEALYRENLLREVEIREAQYESLQAHINPHFLYNTLNTIRWMAIICNAVSIKEVIDSFWAIIKYSYQGQDRFVSLSKEIAMVKKYIHLQKIAYKNTFQVHWDIEKDLLSHSCIKFFLQPIIENSIKHGILPAERKGKIVISLKHEGDDIVLTVFDDGVGMNCSIISDIVNEDPRMDQARHGLANIARRLRFAYGSAFSISAESEAGLFSRIAIRFPREKREPSGD